MTEGWKLKRTAQCAKCPWRKDVDPHDIPNGYCETKHQALAGTIAKPGDVTALFQKELHVMACHETQDAHCVGWLVNQAGIGNNLALRVQLMSCLNKDKIRLRGEQHETFEETLP